MDPSSGLLFFYAALLLHLCLTITAADPYYISYSCPQVANYTANSTYHENLSTLLSSMSSNATVHNGFYNGTAGQESDTVYGIYLCRVGVSSDMCRDCVNASTHRIMEQCPNQKEAIIWYLECMLRYSNRSIFAAMAMSPFSIWGNPGDVRVAVKSNFTRGLGSLMNSLVSRVASTSGSSLVFETGDVLYSNLETIYGLVQCTPDISARDCIRCLQTSVSDLPICCDGKIAGGVHRPSCSLRYATFPFVELTGIAPAPSLISPAPTPMSTTIAGNRANSTNIIIIIVVSTVVVLILLCVICFLLWKRKIPKDTVKDALCEDENIIRSSESLQFDFSTISAATDDFSDANKLGEGGFGSVFKGKLSNGQEIAVKRLSSNSGQGDKEFKNEVVVVAKLQHRNLVKLLGFCLEGEEKLLIYEFMPNASLDYFLFDPVKREQLSWERRYRIIGGITRGLLYLHEESRHKIIHRDLKASNILLDQDMNAKISDFGMAKLFTVDQTRENTNRVVGTFGYMAPEYAIQGHVSVKSDVFSFGVLLLEIVSGRKNTDAFQSEEDGNLLSHAWRKWREGVVSELIDPSLRDCSSMSEVMRCIHIGLLCVQERVAQRPTMGQVVLMLNSYAVPLPMPTQPAFLLHSGTQSNPPLAECETEFEDSTDRSAVFSANGMSITDMSAR